MIIYAHQELTGSLSFAIAVMCNTTGSHISSEKRRDVIVAGRQCYFEKINVHYWQLHLFVFLLLPILRVNN